MRQSMQAAAQRGRHWDRAGFPVGCYLVLLALSASAKQLDDAFDDGFAAFGGLRSSFGWLQLLPLRLQDDRYAKAALVPTQCWKKWPAAFRGATGSSRLPPTLPPPSAGRQDWATLPAPRETENTFKHPCRQRADKWTHV